MSKMVTLQDPATQATVCVRRPDALDAKTLEALGYPGWQVIEELDAMPTETLSPEQQEAVRLAGLSRAEFMAEITARFEGEIAKRDVQIAELAQSTSSVVTPVTEITSLTS